MRKESKGHGAKIESTEELEEEERLRKIREQYGANNRLRKENVVKMKGRLTRKPGILGIIPIAGEK